MAGWAQRPNKWRDVYRKLNTHTHAVPGWSCTDLSHILLMNSLPWQRPVQPSQLLPPAVEAAELHTVDFLSSIFIAWPSARDSNLVTVDTPRTALLLLPMPALLMPPLGFIPFDMGIRVVLRDDCTSGPAWKKKGRTNLTWDTGNSRTIASCVRQQELKEIKKWSVQ